MRANAGYVLQVSSTATGAAKAFKVTSDTNPATDYSVVTPRLDAQITVGDPEQPDHRLHRHLGDEHLRRGAHRHHLHGQ